jgi:hypothetical protein
VSPARLYRAFWRCALELMVAAAWLYARFLRWCVASTDAYMRAAHHDGLTHTRSLQAWTLERDKEMRTIERLENLRSLSSIGGWGQRP